MTFALKGNTTGQLLTLNGKVLTHDNRAELEFLVPYTEVVQTDVRFEDSLPIRFHPDLSHISWPIRKADFR